MYENISELDILGTLSLCCSVPGGRLEELAIATPSEGS